MRIPMVDLVAQYRDLQPTLEPAFLNALRAAQFILGPNVQAFEKEAATYLDVAHAITCANGTDALHLALLAADIGPGDEVITTPFTFIATAEAIAYVGAIAVFVDIDPGTFNIDVAQARRAITPKTKALLPNVRAWFNHHSITNNGMANGHMRCNATIFTDFNIILNNGMTINCNTSTQFNIFANYNIRAN